MEKYDIFQFTAPNGVEVTAVVLDKTTHFAEMNDDYTAVYLCYAQNRIFTYIYTERAVPVCIGQDEYGDDRYEYQDIKEWIYGEVIVDYAILPDYDSQLQAYIDKQNAEEREAIDEWIDSVEQEPYEECRV